MKFKKFLESNASDDQVISFALDAIANSSSYLKNGKFIARGFGNWNNSTAIQRISPVENRKSSNTINHYNLWMSNHESWKDFPRRDSSFICHFQPSQNSGYGNMFVAIPNDHTKIAITQYIDLWDNLITPSHNWEKINHVFLFILWMHFKNVEFLVGIHDPQRASVSWKDLMTAVKSVSMSEVKNTIDDLIQDINDIKDSGLLSHAKYKPLSVLEKEYPNFAKLVDDFIVRWNAKIEVIGDFFAINTYALFIQKIISHFSSDSLEENLKNALFPDHRFKILLAGDLNLARDLDGENLEHVECWFNEKNCLWVPLTRQNERGDIPKNVSTFLSVLEEHGFKELTEFYNSFEIDM